MAYRFSLYHFQLRFKERPDCGGSLPLYKVTVSDHFAARDLLLHTHMQTFCNQGRARAVVRRCLLACRLAPLVAAIKGAGARIHAASSASAAPPLNFWHQGSYPSYPSQVHRLLSRLLPSYMASPRKKLQEKVGVLQWCR